MNLLWSIGHGKWHEISLLFNKDVATKSHRNEIQIKNRVRCLLALLVSEGITMEKDGLKNCVQAVIHII